MYTYEPRPSGPVRAWPARSIKKELTRRTQFIRKSFRDEYLDDLVEAGELVVKFGANGGEVYFPGN